MTGIGIALLVGGGIALAGLAVDARRQATRWRTAFNAMQAQMSGDVAAAIQAGVRPPLPAPADLDQVEADVWDAITAQLREDSC